MHSCAKSVYPYIYFLTSLNPACIFASNLNQFNMKKITLLFAFSLLAVVSLFAQSGITNYNWVAPDQTGVRADPAVYLQGNFVEIGIHPAGSCGTIGTYDVPAGYHAWPSYGGLGFVADFQQDGWETGTPVKSGDYFVPGTPYEAWLLEFTFNGIDYSFGNDGASAIYPSYPYYYPQVPQTSLTNTSAGTTNSALWVGTATGGGQSILVEQNFHFADSDAKFMIDVTLTNTGTEPLQNVEYARAVDPDQEVDWTFDFTTTNYVGNQPDGTNNLAQAVGTGLVYATPLALHMIHPNAKAHVIPDARLEIMSTDEPLDNTNAPTQGAPRVADCGIAVATRIAVLNPGQSVTIPVAYILNEEEVINPPSEVPVSNWALALMVGLIVIFTIIRFKRMN
jgi:hypothetical protein